MIRERQATQRSPTTSACRHLCKHRDQLLVCLYEPSVEPTNNLAERELRNPSSFASSAAATAATPTRKPHAVLASVAQTAHRCGVDFTHLVTAGLRPDAGLLDLLALFLGASPPGWPRAPPCRGRPHRRRFLRVWPARYGRPSCPRHA